MSAIQLSSGTATADNSYLWTRVVTVRYWWMSFRQRK